MKTTTYEQGQRIIDVACKDWKQKLFALWGKKIVLKQYIEITEKLYQIMRNACTPKQHTLFDDIFGNDIPFKIGDWVIGWFNNNNNGLFHRAFNNIKSLA